jgi:hypothetical protein
MESELFTKESVEAIPFGEMSLSVFGDSSWGEDARCQKLFSAITELLKYVDGLGKYGYKPLRLVRVTADFADEVASWQRQLAHSEILSLDCVGKMFAWGDGAMQSTYAVIIVPEKLAADLIEGNDRPKAIAKGILVHEIIHIHDECEMLRNFGPRAMPMSNNWPGIRQDIAEGIWTEFSADHVAYNWLKDYLFEEQVQLAAEILETALEEINQKIVEYREHGDIGTLWQSAGSKLSQTFNQIGRAAGLLTAAQKDDNDQLLTIR